MTLVSETHRRRRRRSSSISSNRTKRIMEHNNSANGGTSTHSNMDDEHKKRLPDSIQSAKREIERLRRYISHYTSKLHEAEMKLRDAKSRLARLQAKTTNACLIDVRNDQGGSNTPIVHRRNEGSSRNLQHQSKSQHSQPSNPAVSPLRTRPSRPSDNPHRLPTQKDNVETRITVTKRRKLEEKLQHKDLIPLICKTSSPHPLNFQSSNHIPSQHKRKLRSLALCPVNDKLFATSALDGVVNLWEVNSRGPGASLHSSTDCFSPNKRWPEDIAWHPEGNKLFSAYSADGQDSQISVMNLSGVRGKGMKDIIFLEDKPHVKGAINNIAFLPWEKSSFVTGGTDHAVILWSENGENKWKPEPLHGDLHTSAVMGVAGMQQKHVVLSAGKDKRILGYDAYAGKTVFLHYVDSRCLSLLPNPCDFHLFMVQAGTPEKQLRLLDVRTKRKELHGFGWKQESSESQSALTNQAWSPNGLYITSGSADPMIHIFDIRYNGQRPSQSIDAHQKRVFRAMWLHSDPLFISISSDLNIGLHKIY